MEETEVHGSGPDGWRGRLLDDARRVASAPAFAPLVFVSLLTWECCILSLRARQKALWYDELVTFHVSGVHPVSALWHALQTGGDGLPVGYYLLVQAGRMLPGSPELTMRATSVAGYLLALLGVYLFASRRLPAVAGLAAALLVSLTPFRAYALEARPYALMVGFLAVAAALWQRSDDRAFAVPLLALSLALAASSHHYAVIAFACFGAAEAAVAVVSRRIRWRVWAAFLFGTLPFLATLPLLLGFRQAYGGTFWSRPMWEEAAWTYGTYVGMPITGGLVLATFLGLALGAMALRSSRDAREQAFSLPEYVLLVGVLCYPALLVFIVKLSNGGYTPRYGWPAILAIALAVIVLAWPHARIRRALVTALLVTFAYQARADVREVSAGSVHPDAARWTTLESVAGGESHLPVVIASPITYLEAAQYIAPTLRARIIGVVDLEKQARLFRTDTPDRANRLLAGIAPLRIVDLQPFEAERQRFLLYSGGDFDWYTPYLLQENADLRLLAIDRGHPIYLVVRSTGSS